MKYKHIEIVIPSMTPIEDAKLEAIQESIKRQCSVSFEFTGEMYIVIFEDIIKQVGHPETKLWTTEDMLRFRSDVTDMSKGFGKQYGDMDGGRTALINKWFEVNK